MIPPNHPNFVIFGIPQFCESPKLGAQGETSFDRGESKTETWVNRSMVEWDRTIGSHFLRLSWPQVWCECRHQWVPTLSQPVIWEAAKHAVAASNFNLSTFFPKSPCYQPLQDSSLEVPISWQQLSPCRFDRRRSALHLATLSGDVRNICGEGEGNMNPWFHCQKTGTIPSG